MKLVGDDGVWTWSMPVPDSNLSLGIRAERVRRSSTGGVQAKVFVEINGHVMSYDDIKVERQDERTHLANDAKRKMGDPKKLPEALRNGEVVRALDTFCLELWPAAMGETSAMLSAGLEPQPLNYVLRPYVIEDGGTIIFAKPERGKSFITLLMAVSIDAGDEVPEERRLWPVVQQRVMLVNLERGGYRYRQRLGMVNRVLGLPVDRPLLMMNQRGHTISDLYDQIRADVKRHEVKCGFVDSISRMGLGDLNTNMAGNSGIDSLNRLFPCWMAVGHTPRGSDEHLYGSMHFDAGADVMVRVVTEKHGLWTTGVGLKIEKANDMPRWEPEILVLNFQEEGLVWVNRPMSGQFPEIDEAFASPSTVQGRQEQANNRETRLWNHMRESGGWATATAIAPILGFARQDVSSWLGNEIRYESRRSGREVLYRAREDGDRNT